MFQLLSRYDSLSGLGVTVPGYRSKVPGFDSRHYQIFGVAVGQEWGPFGLMRITAEIIE
jgi:hypothetical protein